MRFLRRAAWGDARGLGLLAVMMQGRNTNRHNTPSTYTINILDCELEHW